MSTRAETGGRDAGGRRDAGCLTAGKFVAVMVAGFARFVFGTRLT